MQQRLKRLLTTLDLEERILAAAALLACISVFFPWMSGQWLSDEQVSYSGAQFFTAYMGVVIALSNITILVLTIVPAAGGPPMLRRSQRETARVALSLLSSVLTLAALSVLINVTYDYTRMDIRYGIYATFAGSIVATFYAFWKLQEFRKSEPHEHFRHPEEQAPPEEHREPLITPPPPPPPPPLEPEEFREVR